MNADRYRIEYAGYVVNAFGLPLLMLVVMGFTGVLFGTVGVFGVIAAACWSVWMYHMRPKRYGYPLV